MVQNSANDLLISTIGSPMDCPFHQSMRRGTLLPLVGFSRILPPKDFI
jgi:hypothetical protein